MDETQGKLTIWAILVGWILTSVGWIFRSGKDSALAARIRKEHGQTLVDHEGRVRKLEHAQVTIATDTAETKTDVKWIKRHLENNGPK
jgi:hypothetical protein